MSSRDSAAPFAASTAPSPVILVVDDTPDALRFLMATLEGAGMTVRVAIDGLAAIDLIDHLVPDLVLMDAVMPGLDGFETARRIKADARSRHVPIIFMTGLTETEHVLRGFEAGGVDYVHKPILIDELLARVRAHLATARVAQSSQMALDINGRPAFALDGSGNLLWCTPVAAAIFERLFPGWGIDQAMLPPMLAVPLGRLQATDPPAVTRIAIDVGDSRIACAFLRRTAADEWLFRLTEQREGDPERLLADRHGLTLREAEVLLWISRGRKNREISAALGISPRTVSTHLETIFEKMGVENRASAAAIAVGTLAG
jgi:DNA-binding NarL/FixJ family response regulator